MQAKYPRRKGSALVILSAMIMVSLAIASYTINVEYMELVRTEMQISTDLSVRAACRALVDSGNVNDAMSAAQRLANENSVARQTLVYTQDDISCSTATRYSVDQTYDYSNARSNPNSVMLESGFFKRAAAGIDMIFPTFGLPIAFRPVKSATAIQSDIDMAIVLDCSSSMVRTNNQTSTQEGLISLNGLVSLPPDSRWKFSESGILNILDRMELTPAEEHVGICTFGTLGSTETSLTADYREVRSALSSCELPYVGGLSNASDGMLQAGNILSDKNTARPWACRVVLLISDGKCTGADPVATATTLADQYVMVYTISIADEADQVLMQRIAAAGHGEHIHATDVAQFGAMFSELSRRLPILITR
jgi:Ca-activated chloride channel family protein